MSEGARVFARIARRYDRLNSILSLGRDGVWRRRVVEHLPGGRLLDLGAGTGAGNPEFGDREVVAVDPSPQMLALDPEKRRVVAMGEGLPFADGSFDAVFSAFVVRNLVSLDDTLTEVARVLRPGGRLGIVDLGRPASRWKRAIHRAGTAVALPLAGLTVGAPREYWYLHRSLDALPQPDELYARSPLPTVAQWRMGPLGFVYGMVAEKPA